jgi:hypothetical protein
MAEDTHIPADLLYDVALQEKTLDDAQGQHLRACDECQDVLRVFQRLARTHDFMFPGRMKKMRSFSDAFKIERKPPEQE